MTWLTVAFGHLSSAAAAHLSGHFQRPCIPFCTMIIFSTTIFSAIYYAKKEVVCGI
jgi:ABC-type Mn2+/Zn2+ transport system permease subunit